VDCHERVGRDNDAGSLGTKASYRGLDLVISAYRHVDRIDRQQSGGGLKRAEEKISGPGCRVGIENNPSSFDAGRNLLEETKPLATKRGIDVCKSRNVAAGTRHTCDETRAYRIADSREHDRNGSGLSVQRCRHWSGRREDNVGLRSD
jgi:hypothetical protein